MKITLTTLALAASLAAIAGQEKLSGAFYGKNLYIYNANPAKFCVTSVTINGKKSAENTQSSTLEIDFRTLGIKHGDNVEIIIDHQDNCNWSVLNPEVLRPTPANTLLNVKGDKTGIIWSAIGEGGTLPFHIQQFKWDRWVTIGETMGAGKPDTNHYKFELKHNNGASQYRILHGIPGGSNIVSSEVTVRSQNPDITYSVNKNIITFSEETHYEIYSKNGILVLDGRSTEADISPLEKGTYYLGYANKADKIDKK